MHSNSPEPETHVKLPGFPTALPIVGTVDLRTGKVSLNPLGMILLLSKSKRKPEANAQRPKTEGR